MKHFTLKILLLVATAAAALSMSAPARGQMLVGQGRGTVLEQLERMRQPYDEQVLEATDYIGMYHNVCYWSEEMAKGYEPSDSISGVITRMLDFAASFTGTRYRRGASGPKAFDCSGFTSYVFKQFGYSLNRSSSGQIYDGEQVEKDELRPGDLVFFNGRAVNNSIGHVGIVTEVDSVGDGFRFIHASTSRGVRVSSFPDEEYFGKRYMGACRPIHGDDGEQQE